MTDANENTKPESNALCALSGVTQDFPQPHGAALRVLDDVSLWIGSGEVVALLGPSGCGKSTILRILAGLTHPTGGRVLYHGQTLQGLNPGVGFVFQSFALFPWMTVRENVEAGLKPLGLAADEIRARATSTITLVGLASSADAYPREISGGMKQRVGMARALALNPEMLFMDEPFSQVDALTAESLRAEVLDLFAAKEKNLKSIVMVSHDIKEVAWMADRIVVLAAKPGRVRTVVENKLPRPRNFRSTDFLKLVDRLHDIITGSEMPDDVPARPPTGALEPLPLALAGEIVGLLEYLDGRGGREDVFRIAVDTNREYGDVIAAVNAAELLELVDTPRRTALLEPLASRFLQADTAGRKVIWREQILRLPLFKRVAQALNIKSDGQMEADVVREMIVVEMPYESQERMFQVFLSWSRYGDLLTYDEGTDTLSTVAPPEPAAATS
jgi:NitT/TauT family transport system ATP-binding protein